MTGPCAQSAVRTARSQDLENPPATRNPTALALHAKPKDNRRISHSSTAPASAGYREKMKECKSTQRNNHEDISIVAKQGTFLKWLDTSFCSQPPCNHVSARRERRGISSLNAEVQLAPLWQRTTMSLFWYCDTFPRKHPGMYRIQYSDLL